MVDVERIFTYYPPKPDQIPRYEELRAAAKAFAKVVEHCCPGSAEATLAIRKIQEAVMYANASIAINEAENGP